MCLQRRIAVAFLDALDAIWRHVGRRFLRPTCDRRLAALPWPHDVHVRCFEVHGTIHMMAAKSTTWSYLKRGWDNDLAFERASRSLAKTGSSFSSFLVSFFCVFFRVLFGCPKGSQRVPKRVQNRWKRGLEKVSKNGSQKSTKNDDCQDPWMWLKYSKYKRNRWFSCSGLGSLWGLFLGSFWEPKWTPKAWKSGSKKSFKNRSKKWSIFCRFWGPFWDPKWSPKWSKNWPWLS